MNVAEWRAILSSHNDSEEVLLFDSEYGEYRELAQWDIKIEEQTGENNG